MMWPIILNEKYTLSFQQLGKKIRLTISEGDKELVCRKETLKNLDDFLLKEEIGIFKGRLQLYKHKAIIEVIMKGKPIAILSSKKMEKVLNKLRKPIY